MSNSAAKDLMEKREDTMVMSMSVHIKEGRSTFGKYKFHGSRTLFSKLMIGNPVPPRFYSYWVKPEQIATSIQFLQEQLPVIPGLTRNIKINGHLFQNLPVYSSGGHSLVCLFASYGRVYPKEHRIGRNNFLEIGKMMCKKGKI